MPHNTKFFPHRLVFAHNTLYFQQTQKIGKNNFNKSQSKALSLLSMPRLKVF